MAVRNPFNILILGFGNADRQDDGVSWHILRGLAEKLGQPVPEQIGDEFSPLANPTGNSPYFLFVLQLAPELAETVARYDVVCFVDAHTGNVELDLNFAEMNSEFQTSPFTHHMTPQTLLALAGALYGHTPQGFLLSVRGYEFGFSTALSNITQELAGQAVEKLLAWLKDICMTGDNLPAPR
jgi:Ni,Fe-hydrogenase maturation factor